MSQPMRPISQIIKSRLIQNKVRYFANDNISDYITDEEMDLLVDEVEQKVQSVLESLVIDTQRDHNSNGTARRVAKMYIKEIYEGRYSKQPSSTCFPNFAKYDGLYVCGPITIRSSCAHHQMPIVGKAYVGIFPGEKVIGLSKFNRLITWIASRPQIQEEMTSQIADVIMKETEAKGVAVLMKAEHFCMTHRGVKEHESDMTTSVLLGELRENQSLKNEFLTIVGNMK